MWAVNSVFYQIYPLGFCGAPKDNDGVLVPRIRKVMDWIPHLKRLQAYCAQLSGMRTGNAVNLLSGECVSLCDGYLLPPFSLFIWRI